MKIIKKINYEKSLDYYNKVKSSIEIQQGGCYNNVFNFINGMFIDKLIKGDFKIAYCYVGLQPLPMLRHCVVLDEEDDIIDISVIYTHKNEGNIFGKWEYNIFKVMKNDEYIHSIEKNDFRCDLPNCKEEYEWYIKKQIENPFFQVVEHDYYSYIVPMVMKDDNRYQHMEQVKNRLEELLGDE
ncbi:TPA: hypothetical protein ACXDAZ_002627 [Clostridium botulinum]